MLLLGFDIGSSAVKACLLDGGTGAVITEAVSPDEEMAISSPRPGWAEQDPDLWWRHVIECAARIRATARLDAVGAVGIAYQMHGLVAIDRERRLVRPAIIWCDSRAVGIGERAFRELGESRCLEYLLNAPGNFTASKLRWVAENEPEVFARIDKILLPGDYTALRMTGEALTTDSGLSEAVLWDFRRQEVASWVMEHFAIPPSMIPERAPTFSIYGELTRESAEAMGLRPGIPVSYRAGDQPNNAWALNVREPGEIAASAGTSGVVYGVQDAPRPDPRSRVNVFLHVNHAPDRPRLGVLACVNGAGSANRWARQHLVAEGYDAMNARASQVPAGAEGLVFLPYGNGAERTLGNRNVGGGFFGLDWNVHTAAHLFRAVQEGVAFAMRLGMDIMIEMGIEPSVIRAGQAGMFLSAVFASSFADATGATVELYDTDGAQGAARGAGLGAGYYRNADDAFVGLRLRSTIEPRETGRVPVLEAYNRWHAVLQNLSEKG